ncbi:hypothetical protein M408DRAFT_19456 [Serendipita vermifera MAFF 305830]|uniref:C3H1-type domain-containing protein n=1 Tax=Serendipita vermifera MAFF 305830 TaxID=933852 RepID=A0A0C2Y0E0_SERVB|nr:hypothetical protein M408DRAFT_19456 [Serendipita vermifera MAFF 305830]
MATAAGESTVNGTDASNDAQRQHPGNNVPNGMPVYPYPPPPGAMYPMGMSPEMFQGAPGGPGQRMMLPMPYPYPHPQPGQPGQPMSPNGYAFPTMMAPPPPSGNGNASPSSPNGAPMPPYGPYGMWYPAPGMGMPPPPGNMSSNGMQPIPVPMGSFPPPQPMYMPPQPQGDGQNGVENGQKAPNGEHTNGVAWVPGPGGLPPKEVAQTIPCKYFPDCRFGTSCWFLHPGADSSNAPSTPSNPQDSQAPRPFFPGPLPPPVRYGPTGPYDPSAPSPNPNEAGSDANKSAYPSPTAGPNPATAGYGLMYAPYPYPNGYPHIYPPQPTHSQQSPNGGASHNSSQPSHSQPMSPQHMAHQLQQNPPSQPQSPPPNMPAVYPTNGTQGGWYPGQFPPGMPMGVPMQPMPPSHPGPGMMPISPVSPSTGPNGAPVHGMGLPSQAMSPGNAPAPLQSPPHHPAHVPYPISPPYSSAPLHPNSPPQPMHTIPPQPHPASPQALYGNQPPQSTNVPVMPTRGHHSRRESMSSMAAVPMGQVLGPHLDGNGTVDGARSPPSSAFRDMMDNGFAAGARRGRGGGHSSRGSWGGGNGFGQGARRTPCAFFPAGKCKNGDNCRFPHILNPDGSAPVSPTSPRGGYPGSFGRANGSRRPTILGPTLEDKMADLSVKEQAEGQENGDANARTGGYPKPYSSSPKTRGARASLSTPSTPGHRQNAHLQAQQQSQRLPSADDFPVLGHTATPPPPVAAAPAATATGNGHGYASAWSGPTAAQVLKGGIGAKKAAAPSTSVNGDAPKGTADASEANGEEAPRAADSAEASA